MAELNQDPASRELQLPARRNAQVALRKAKNLIEVTDRILAGRDTRLTATDDGWIQRLRDWADQNHVSYSWISHEDDISDPAWIEESECEDYGHWRGLPWEKRQLMELEDLDLFGYSLTEISPEIGRLTELQV